DPIHPTRGEVTPMPRRRATPASNPGQDAAPVPVRRRSVLAGAFAALGGAALEPSRAAAAAEVEQAQALAREKIGQAAPVGTGDKLRVPNLNPLRVNPRWLFLKVHTDAGIVGLGEPVVEGRALTVAQAVKEIEPYLVGKDPRQVAHHWQAIYRHAFYRGGPVLTSALSGVDMALWDIKGKAPRGPVYELLGGASRTQVRGYAPTRGGPAGVKAQLAQGFTAFKTGPAKRRPSRYVETPAEVKYAAERFAALRAQVGDGIDLAIDFHGAISPATAKLLIKAL